MVLSYQWLPTSIQCGEATLSQNAAFCRNAG
jgi:hypothetical protein